MNLPRWTSLYLCLALVAWGATVRAQDAPEKSPFEIAAAMEKVVVDLVEQNEGSVVSIARVRTDERPSALADRFDQEPGFFPRGGFQNVVEPTSPQFVPQEYATGVVLDAKGLILTTYHAIGAREKCKYFVWSNQRPFAAEVIAADPWLDLAVLKIDAPNLTPIKLGDAKTLRKGQFVIALGNPFGIARDGRPSAAWGLVSNLDRKAPAIDNPQDPIARPTLHHYGNLIETDARLEQGTSGGPLLNLQGEMIGLTTSLAAPGESGRSAGLAIPVDQALKDALEKLTQGREAEYGFLGLAPEVLSVEERQRGKHGARVSRVVPGTPAAELNLVETSYTSDSSDVITHVDGEAVRDADHLILLLSRVAAGREVRLTVERATRGDDKSPRITQKRVKLSKKYLGDVVRPIYTTVSDPPWRGLTIDYATATPNFQERLSYLDPDGCLAVVEVARPSPAWDAGLRGGMFISHVGDERVTTPEQFRQLTSNRKDAVKLRTTQSINGSSMVSVAP
jgi:serine protease Do